MTRSIFDHYMLWCYLLSTLDVAAVSRALVTVQSTEHMVFTCTVTHYRYLAREYPYVVWSFPYAPSWPH